MMLFKGFVSKKNESPAQYAFQLVSRCTRCAIPSQIITASLLNVGKSVYLCLSFRYGHFPITPRIL